MTKKDYELIAQTIRIFATEPEDFAGVFEDDQPADQYTVRIIAYRLAGELQIDNSRFDRERFLTACGF